MWVPEICAHYGWTYDEYMDAPTWLITLTMKKMELDAKENQRQADKAKHSK